MQEYKNVDEYLANFSGETLDKLKKLRSIIKENVPAETEEKIAYGIPTYKLKRNIVHFGGYDSHVALYPGAGAIEALGQELEGYKTAKGTVQFPINKPLPEELVVDLVKISLEKIDD